MAKMTMIQALNLALRQEMEKDDRVIVLGEDVGLDGGVFRVTEGLFQQFGETRVVDTPLAESGIVGMSIGMAVYGLRPVCEIQFSGFDYHILSNRKSRCPPQVALPGPFQCSHGFKSPIRGRRSRPGASLRKPGSLLGTHPRNQDGDSLRSAQCARAFGQRYP